MKPKSLLVTALVGVFLSGCGKKAGTPAPPSTPEAGSPAVPPAATVSPNLDFGKLNGKWLRPDGGYILELRSAGADGSLTAGYLNPRPIRVGRAAWQRKGAGLQVFVELRDTNYPGSTYTLDYSAAGDRLTGIYYQAALRESYTVEFVRQP